MLSVLPLRFARGLDRIGRDGGGWPMLLSSGRRPAQGLVELDFVDAVGTDQCLRLSSCIGVRFEDVRPVRTFRWSRGLGHFPGWWWSATTGRHIGHESWLERDHVRALDFDRDITAIASQPFWLHWEGQRARRRHAPD